QQQVLAVGEGTVAHGRIAAAHADQADLDQGQADHQHHDAGHQRRDQAFDEGQDARYAHLDKGAGNHHAEDGRHHRFHRRALTHHQHAASDQRADEVEAGALHDQQPGAERPEALALHEGGDAGNHQGHGNDDIGVARRYTDGLADQQAGSDDGYDDRQQMLQRREEGDPGARPVVEAVDQVVRRFGGGVILGSAHGRPLEKERDFTGWGMERTV